VQGFADAILEKVFAIPVRVNEAMPYEEAKPSGVFHVEDNGSMEIEINGIDPRRFERDRAHAGYTSYVNGVLYHEFVHAVDYLEGLFSKYYNERKASGELFGEEYYRHPVESQAYYSMMADFFERFLKIPKSRMINMMQRYTTEPDRQRPQWLRNIRDKAW
jgi:hypothetical protein